MRNYLNDIGDEFNRQAQLKGFHNPSQSDAEFIKEFVANTHAEVSEFWEAFRRGEINSPCDKQMEMIEHGIQPLTCGEEEIADILIRTLGAARRLGIDVGKSVTLKSLFNATREYRHGGKLA